MDTSEDSEFRNAEQGIPVYDFLRMYPNRYYVLNLCSNYPIGTMLTNLIPPVEIQALYFEGRESEFKQAYINHIFNNKSAYLDFLSILIYDYYCNGDGCVVLTNLHNPIIACAVDYLIESYKMKYRYVPTIGYTVNDLVKAKDNNFPIAYMGLFIGDKEYYIYNTTDPKHLMETSIAVEDFNGSMV